MAYTLLLKEKSTIEFATSRLVRIIPPYYFYTILIVCVGQVFSNVNSSSATFITVLQSLLFIPHENPDPNLGVYPTLSVGWTLNLEMFFYFLLSILLILRVSMTSKLVLAATVMLVFPVIFRLLNIELYSSVAGNVRLFEFAEGLSLGILFVRYSKLFHSSYLKVIASCIFFITIFVSFPLIIKDILMSAVIVYFVLIFRSVFSIDNVVNRILIYLGKISYSLYLSHAVVIMLVWVLIPNLTSGLVVGVSFLLVIVFTLGTSHISYKLIETKVSSHLYRQLSTLLRWRASAS